MLTFVDLAPTSWVFLAVAALFVGVSKTALPGINVLSIVLFATVLPAKASTGALLLLLIVGDILALLAYRRHADWATLIRLIPPVCMGLAAGAVFLAFVDDGGVRRAIGVILLLVIAATLWQRLRPRSVTAVAVPTPPSSGQSTLGEPGKPHLFARLGYGALSGFTTMVANAGGPVMSMYFLTARFTVTTFLGTSAWFFAVLNLAKLPVSIGLGLVTLETLTLDLILVPAVILGAVIGLWIARRIPQHIFDWAVIAFTALGASYLLV